MSNRDDIGTFRIEGRGLVHVRGEVDGHAVVRCWWRGEWCYSTVRVFDLRLMLLQPEDRSYWHSPSKALREWLLDGWATALDGPVPGGEP